MNNLTIGENGFIIDGTWYNPYTNDTFTVLDVYFQDNDLLIKTTDNRIINYAQMQHYVKSTEPIPQKKTNEQKTSLKPKNLHENITNNKIKITDMPDTIDINNISNNPMDYSSNDLFIINKALNKYSLPKINITIEDDENFPKNQIMMLQDMMDININDIVKWYINQININDIKDIISEEIKNYIEKISINNTI